MSSLRAWWLIGVVGLITCFPISAHAAPPPVIVVPNEAVAIPLSFTATPLTTYHLKARFSDSSTTCSPTCLGQTWNGTDWLDQNDDWTLFPTVTTDATGQLKTFLIARLTDDSRPALLQIANRTLGSSTTQVFTSQTQSVQYLADTSHLLQVRTFEPDGSLTQNGILHADTILGQQWAPIFDGQATLTLMTNSPKLELLDLDGAVRVPPQPYLFPDSGRYTLTLNAPAAPLPPLTITGATTGHPNEPLTLTAAPAVGSPIEWYIDGVRQSSTSPSLTFTSPRAGVKMLTAIRMSDNQSVSWPVAITSVGGIIFSHFLPNPTGRDTKEEIYLTSNNPGSVTLTNWSIRSRTSKTALAINLTLLPHQPTLVTTSNKLINSAGTYDLYNESDELVDTASYTNAPENDYLTRDGLVWHFTAVAQAAETPSDTQTIEGAVVHPHGKSFDVVTGDGITHVVIHPSFTGVKPRFHTHDIVRVSGVLQVNTHGVYLSVGDSNTLIVLTSAAVKHTAKPVVARAKAARKTRVAPTRPASSPSATASTPNRRAPPWTPATTQAEWLRWWLALLFGCGFLLLTAPKRNIV